MNKKVFRKYNKPLNCLRIILLYILFLFLAKYSYIFRTGFIPKEILSTIIAVCLILYRFLSIAVVPAVLIIWVLENISNKNFGKLGK